MASMLIGVETEYAFTALDRDGRCLERVPLLKALLAAVRRRQPYLNGANAYDLYLGNGSRLYVDCGRHPEYSTPECTHPTELVRHVRAGERLLARAARAVERSEPQIAQALLFKCNVDYVNTNSTWGSHESYLYQTRDQSEMATQIIPHLVSRVIFAGAGGLNPRSSGIEFTLSPRAAHLTRAISGCSTDDRGIFHRKDESLASSGYHRLHLICGESLCSQLADYLRVGTTALIVKLIEAGLQPGAAVRLTKPVEALRAYVADTSCTVRAATESGPELAALEIQRHYLEAVEERIDADFMPDWAAEVCARWRMILDALATDKGSLTTRLDWPLKLALLHRWTRGRGIEWAQLGIWNRTVGRLTDLQPKPGAKPYTQRQLKSRLLERGAFPADIKSMMEILESHGISLAQACQLFRNLRAELCETDTRFGQLGEAGIFAGLDATGALEHAIISEEDVADAVNTPPSGRARRRGDEIQHRQANRHSTFCSWTRIEDAADQRYLDLSDPFGNTEPKWGSLSKQPLIERRGSELSILRALRERL